MDPTVTAIQQYGALAILALMVWKLPAVIIAISAIVESMIKHVRETQTEALTVFKSENDKILGMLESRFETIETALNASVKSNTEMIGELKELSTRLGELERERSPKNAS